MMNYEQAIEHAKYAAISMNNANKRGDTDAYKRRAAEVAGMCKIIATIYDKWDEDEDCSTVVADVFAAAARG